MTDKLQKIRAEIERLQDGLMDAQGRFCTNAAESAYHILCHLENFINSMQEEHTIPDIVDEHWWEMLGEEPVSEDLEEAAKHYLYSNILYDDVYVGNPTDNDCVEMFKAGAQWQKEKMMKEAKESQVILTRITNATLAPSLSSVILDDSFKEGDKVKVIVIKDV